MSKLNYIVIDTETIGFPVRKTFNTYWDPKEYDIYYNQARMIEIGFIKYKKETNEYLSEYSSLVIPDNFVIENSNIHGITTENATKLGKDINIVLDNLEKELEDCDLLVGHNINFDKHIILAECFRYNKTNLISLLNNCQTYCTMFKGKEYMNVQKVPKLIELYQFLFKQELQQNHRALEDVKATSVCYQQML